MLCCFKQKTAYEGRMSDWRSDVCSSDLLLVDSRLGHTELQLTRVDLNEILRDVAEQVDSELQQKGAEFSIHPPLPHVSAHALTLTQIGSASCRGRVCMSVYISVVAVSIKKP